MTHEQEVIWLAGLLEGEGCFRVEPGYRPSQPSCNRRGVLRVKLEMVDMDVVRRASAIFPTKALVYTNAARNRNRRGTYTFQWSGADAKKVMVAVLPYMGKRRSTKIRECLLTPNLSHTPKGTA